MADITTREINDKEVWENFIKGRPEANFLQSWDWGEFHTRLGDKIHRVGFYNDDELLFGVMLAVVLDARRGRYLTVPGGPIIDWQSDIMVGAFRETVEKLAREERCVFVRVRPQLMSDDFSKKLFRRYNFRPAPIHLHAELTLQLDITKSDGDLLAGMRKATRYEIKRAQKLGINMTTSENPDDIKQFYDIQLATSRRQGFVPFPYKFLHEQFKAFSTAGNALLYSAYYEEKLLAQAFIIFYGNEAAYHYGASTDDGRKYPGAYLIQWQAIQEAKRRGIRRYNFWGIAPEREKNHRFSGLSLFKRGFGGEEVEYLHAQDLVINRLRYALVLLVEIIRKKIRRV